MDADDEYIALPDSGKLSKATSLTRPPPELLMVTGALVMTALNANVKYWPISLVVFIAGRYSLQWAICFMSLLLRSALSKQPLRLFGPAETRHWLLIRGVIYYMFVWAWWATLRLVPVGNAVTVVKFECFVTGLGSCFLFGERLTQRWWACSAAALLGVLLVTQPPFLFGGLEMATSGWGIALNLLTPFLSGSLALFIKMAPGAHYMEVQHATDFVSGIFFSPALLMFFGNPSELLDTMTLEGILCTALLGLTALCLNTAAYQGGAAGRMSLLSYIEVPASYMVQVFAFGGTLDPLAMCGTVLIIGASMSVAFERSK